VKKRILDRYETMQDGNVIIDVAARRIEELYDNFDKRAPYHRKDFDDDLVEYLTGCVREIGQPAFVVRFTIEQGLSKELMEMVRSGMHSFFMYRMEVEYAALKKMIRTSSLLLLSGVLILALSLWVSRFFLLNGDGSFSDRFFVEGLTIIAWVSIWEGLATFLLNFTPHLYRIRIFRWLAAAHVSFGPPGYSG